MLQSSFGPSQTFGANAPGFVRDLTEADLSSHLGTVSSSGGLYVQFFYDRVRIDSQDPAVNGTYQIRLCVAKQPKGDRLTIAHQYVTEAEARARWPREFDAFTKAEAIPTTGTPLHELPGISTSQIALLTLHNLRSVEDLAEAPAEHVNQMGMDAIAARTLAVRWVQSKQANGDLIDASQKDAAMTAELEALRKADQEKTKAILELTAKLEVLMRVGAPAAPAQAAQSFNVPIPVMVDNSPDLPTGPSRLFEGSMDVVTGNEDLMDDPPPADPLNLKPRRR